MALKVRNGRFTGLLGFPAGVLKMTSDAWPLQLDFAPVKSQLSLGPPPAIPILAVITAITDPAQPSCVLRHHASQCSNPRRQAETLEARPNFLPSLSNDCRRDNPRRCDRLTHGVALLRGFSTPSLLAQGGQRPHHIFNIVRGIPALTPRIIDAFIVIYIPTTRRRWRIAGHLMRVARLITAAPSGRETVR